MVVGASQILQFFGQKNWFHGSNRALTKFRYQILDNLISFVWITGLVLSNYKKNNSLKANLKLNKRFTGSDFFSYIPCCYYSLNANSIFDISTVQF